MINIQNAHNIITSRAKLSVLNRLEHVSEQLALLIPVLVLSTTATLLLSTTLTTFLTVFPAVLLAVFAAIFTAFAALAALLVALIAASMAGYSTLGTLATTTSAIFFSLFLSLSELNLTAVRVGAIGQLQELADDTSFTGDGDVVESRGPLAACLIISHLAVSEHEPVCTALI